MAARGGVPTDPGANPPAEVEGEIERVTFHNEETLYTVLRVRTGRQVPGAAPPSALFDSRFAAVGATARPSEGLRVRLVGQWAQHRTHGLQFEFERLELLPPKDSEGLVRYLASKTFEGVGEVLARRIVDHLGLDALRRIRDEPLALTGVPGLRADVREKLAATVVQALGTHQLVAFLLGLGLAPWQAEAVIAKYGVDSAERLRRNPYLLCSGVSGIGFVTADRVARRLGLPADGIERRRAALLHALQESASEGHTCRNIAALFAEGAKLLGDEPAEAGLRAALEGLAGMGELRLESDGAGIEHAWLPHLFTSEVGVAQSLARLLAPGAPRPWADPARVEHAARRQGIQLHPRQAEAVLGLLTHPVGLLTGGPGVGKTTIVRLVVDLARSAGARVLLASPTGRAAKRLAEATGAEAATVHRTLGFDPAGGRFAHDAKRPLEADLVVVDEISMLDLVLAHHLFKSVQPPTRLILVGDPDQLPSVAAGNVLSDLLESRAIPTFRLTEIYRQDSRSLIVENAHRILKGEMPRFPAPNAPRADFYFFPVEGEEAAADRLVEVVTRRIPEAFSMPWERDVQVLAPMYRGACGVDALNDRLRAALEHTDAPRRIRGRDWRVGERVIHTRNDYEREVFNGDMGRIEHISAELDSLTVRFPERTLVYDAAQLSDLASAFAVTVHRSQGGEFPAVVMPLVMQHWMMLQRHLLYTAITRARKLVVLVGSPRALATAISNAEQAQRESGLAARLQA